MDNNFISFYPHMIAFFLGSTIAATHLAMVRLSVRRITAQPFSMSYVVIMSLLRMGLVAISLILLAQNTSTLSMLYAGAGFFLCRLMLIPLFTARI